MSVVVCCLQARLDCALDTVRDTELRLQTVQARALEDMQAAQLVCQHTQTYIHSVA